MKFDYEWRSKKRKYIYKLILGGWIYGSRFIETQSGSL